MFLLDLQHTKFISEIEETNSERLHKATSNAANLALQYGLFKSNMSLLMRQMCETRSLLEEGHENKARTEDKPTYSGTNRRRTGRDFNTWKGRVNKLRSAGNTAFSKGAPKLLHRAVFCHWCSSRLGPSEMFASLSTYSSHTEMP